MIKIHGQLLEEGESGRYDTSPIYIGYQMKDGRMVERHYYYSNDGDAAKGLEKFLSLPEYILGYEDWDAFLSSVNLVSVEGEDLKDAEAAQLLEAIKADCEAGRMGQYKYEGVYWVDIRVSGRYHRQILIDRSCKESIAWLDAYFEKIWGGDLNEI